MDHSESKKDTQSVLRWRYETYTYIFFDRENTNKKTHATAAS